MTTAQKIALGAEACSDLTKSEASRLAKCETAIASGLRSFVEVGLALAEIRDARLYRDTHGTFEKYCRDRWGFAKSYAHYQIAAAALTSTIVDADLPAPATEAVARELLRAPEEDRESVWREAVDTAPDGKVTARHVRQCIDAMYEDEEAEEENNEPPEELEESDPQEQPEAEREPATEVVEPESIGESHPLDWIRTAWDDLDDELRRDFIREVGAVMLDDLETLRTQRESDAEFSVVKQMYEVTAANNRGMRIAVAVLDGGDAALALLGLSWSSTLTEAKTAYKASASAAHPDKGGSAERFRGVTAAWDVVRKFLEKRAA